MAAQIKVIPPKRLAYTYEDACLLLAGISMRTLSNIIASGKLKPIDGRHMIAHSELERYLKDESKKYDGRRGRYNMRGNDNDFEN